MAEEESYTQQEFHKKMAVDLFNTVWDYLDRAERTPQEEKENRDYFFSELDSIPV